MRQFKFPAAVLAASILAGCGGGGAGDQTAKVKYSALVSFGDSLSDIGTYAVGTVKALGGGKYTVNGPDGKNWTELLAAQLGVSAPCAAQTGLNGDAAQGFSVPVTNHPGCTGYAQGGARVTNPIGPGNAALGGSNAVLGQLTDPVINQITRHLAAAGGSFKADEVVTVLAGGNDLFLNLAALQAGATAAANAAGATAATQSGATAESIAAAAQAGAASYVQTNAPTYVRAMGVAGAELAGYVNNLILAKGAKYVVVVNLPDASTSPSALSKDAATRGLINTMVTTFNAQLSQGLGTNAGLLYVDAYTAGRDEVANPVQYGLTNVTSTACNLTAASNPLGSALTCTTANVVSGDVSHYLFADDTGHMTPYGYSLLTKLVTNEMAKKGWL